MVMGQARIKHQDQAGIIRKNPLSKDQRIIMYTNQLKRNTRN